MRREERRSDYAVVSIGILLAGTLTLPYLGNRSFWVDETVSVIYAHDDWTSLWQAMLRDRNMWLYYTLLHLWLKLGESEFLVRSLSAVFALATIPVIYSLGTRLFGSRVGSAAALLLSVNAFFIRYAQEARGYSLLVLLTIISSYCFVGVIERFSWRDWAAHGVSGVLAIYAHAFGALVFIAHVMSVAFLPRRDIPWRGLIGTGTATGLLSLPLILATNTHQLDWVVQPRARDIGTFFMDLAGGAPSLLAYSLLLLAALGFAVMRSPRSEPSHDTWRLAFLLTWLLVPLVIAFSFSFFVKPVFVGRYLIICLPPFVLLAAVGLSRLGHRWLFATALGIVLILSGLAVNTRNTQEDWKGATTFVLSEARPDDAVLFYAYFVRQPFEYYLRRLGKPSDFPKLLELASNQQLVGERPPDPDWKLLERLPHEYTRVWLVLSHSESRGRAEQRYLIQRSLAREYAVAQKREFKGIRVLQYERLLHGSVPDASEAGRGRAIDLRR